MGCRRAIKHTGTAAWWGAGAVEVHTPHHKARAGSGPWPGCIDAWSVSTLAIKCLVSDMGPNTHQEALISIIHPHQTGLDGKHDTPPPPQTTQGLWVGSTVRSVGIWVLWRCDPEYLTWYMVSRHQGALGVRWSHQRRRWSRMVGRCSSDSASTLSWGYGRVRALTRMYRRLGGLNLGSQVPGE